MEKQSGLQQITLQNPYVTHPVHVYVKQSAQNCLLFDAGPDTSEAESVISENLDISGIDYIFLTHWHADHAGRASRLAELSGAEIILSRSSVRKLNPAPTYEAQMAALLTALGFPATEAAELVSGYAYSVRKVTPSVPEFRVLEESSALLGDLGIESRHCTWHSQGDVIYLIDDHAVSGDTCIRGMFHSPLLDVDCDADDGRAFDNYAAFCTSLVTLAALDSYRFCPGHRQELDSSRQWVVFAVRMFLKKAARLAPIRAQGASVYQALQKLGQGSSQSAYATFAAASSIAFHYEFLARPELLIVAMQRSKLFAQLAEEFRTCFSAMGRFCRNHPDRSATLICPCGLSTCQECLEQAEMRIAGGGCSYCPDIGTCPLQQHYREPEQFKLTAV